MSYVLIVFKSMTQQRILEIRNNAIPYVDIFKVLGTNTPDVASEVLGSVCYRTVVADSVPDYYNKNLLKIWSFLQALCPRQ
jgi:hypothetical protein